AILVVDEGDPSAPVGVVLDGRDLAGNADLVTLEIDLPVKLLVAAALVADGDLALVVPPGVGRQGLDQALLGPVRGYVLEGRCRHEAPPRAGWLELANRHLLK